MWRDFEERMKAENKLPGSKEYLEAHQALRSTMYAKYSTEYPETPYRDIGWSRPSFKLLNEEIEESLERRGKILGAQYKDEAAFFPEGSPNAAFLKRQYLMQFEEEGLDPKWLDYSEPPTSEDMLWRDAVAFYSTDPWVFTDEERRSHKIEFTPQTDEYIARALEKRNEIDDFLSEHRASFWDDDASGIRTHYYEYVRSLALQDKGFAAIWNYYQTPKWERLRNTGTLTSPEWDKWFDIMTQVNTRINENRAKWREGTDKQTDIQVFRWQIDRDGKLSATSKTARRVAEVVGPKLEQWKRDNPEFKEEFERFPISFWNIERDW